MSQPKALTPGGDSLASFDINVSGIDGDRIFDVSKVDRVAIQATASTWTTAVVTLKRGADKNTFAAMSPASTLTAAGQTWDLAVKGQRFLALDVTTPEGTGSTATFELYGFDDRAPPWAEYFIANVSTTDLNQTAKTQFDYDSITYEDSSYFSLNASTGEVTIYKAGWYDLYANCAFNNAVVRSSVRSQFHTGGGAVSLTSQCAGSYIRATVGHNEASSSMQYRFLFAAGTTVGTWGTRAAAAGVISPWNSFCNFRLQKIS